jgi:CheY-like chemotaxis protein
MMKVESKQLKILFIEDQKEYSLMVGKVLSERFEIKIVANGLEAMNALDTGFLPDVIVTDLMMPVLDGYRFIHVINRHEIYKSIPVVVLTGIDYPDLNRLHNRGQVIEVVMKPFNVKGLKTKVIPAIEKALNIQLT